MSEKEKRLAYNKRAAELNAQYQMWRYPGMIQGVEIPAMGSQGGIGLISVVDAVNEGLKPEHRYNPAPGKLLVDGKEVKTPGEQRGMTTSIMPPNMRNTVMHNNPTPAKTDRQYNLRSFLK